MIGYKEMMETAGKVLQKARTDPEFHALALKDGTAAVEQVLGSPLPDGVKIRFVENTDVNFTLGIPPLRTSDELSDRDLEKVAGGRDAAAEGADIGISIAAEVPGVVAGFLRR